MVDVAAVDSIAIHNHSHSSITCEYMREMYEPVTALLVLRHGLCDANDYGIMRCLEWRFDWLHWSESYLLTECSVLSNRAQVADCMVATHPFAKRF